MATSGVEDPDLRAAQELLRQVEAAVSRAAEVLRQARQSLALAERARRKWARRLGKPLESAGPVR